MTERKFQRVGNQLPETFRLEKEGDKVEGTYIRRVDGLTSKKYKKPLNAYVLKMDDGTERTVWGSGLLDYLMDQVEPGVYVRITYTGKQKVEGNQVKQFTVEKAV